MKLIWQMAILWMVVCACLYYADTFSDNALACHDKGGKMMDGECFSPIRID